MSLDRLKCYAAVSAYIHLGLAIIGIYVFVVLMVVEVASEYTFMNSYEDNKLTAMYFLAAGLVYHILLFCFSLVAAVGISRRKNLLLAPFVTLIYTLISVCGLLALSYFIGGLWNGKAAFGKLLQTLLLSFSLVGAEALIFSPVHKLYQIWRDSPPCSRLEEQQEYEAECEHQEVNNENYNTNIYKIHNQHSTKKGETLEDKVVYI
ncbi:uncharacterized protein LOC106088045 isoform X1 [Stomoxys calcitrans]|uniref:uncharacterized protein LOC106088045 isoform X1 n=1 Tax=Stomoxys calcitrans TaxID=35570 RepID=UPI0027E304E3|nr:uncharacterized protein LOC106088045 isoform X1 [Stomoxys calcitrans]XP_059225527.1 uncharacterized protein LOC106088045 isoform X1 [Stomoxys calcitrans]